MLSNRTPDIGSPFPLSQKTLEVYLWEAEPGNKAAQLSNFITLLPLGWSPRQITQNCHQGQSREANIVKTGRISLPLAGRGSEKIGYLPISVGGVAVKEIEMLIRKNRVQLLHNAECRLIMKLKLLTTKETLYYHRVPTAWPQKKPSTCG